MNSEKIYQFKQKAAEERKRIIEKMGQMET